MTSCRQPSEKKIFPPGALSLPLLLWGWDVIFVVGLYKSGTSLCVKLCTIAGFRDPSRQTNSKERGYGRWVERYSTHECSVLRRLNEDWMSQRDSLGMISPAENYLLAWGAPTVLKDPRFVFTLPNWIAAARRIGFTAGVIFTCRQWSDLLTAWDDAPFTKDLLIKGQLRKYARGCEEQIEWCQRKHIPHLHLTLEDLRWLVCSQSGCAYVSS
jgi:hypothetical protein